MKQINFSEKTKKIILNRLKIDNLEQVLSMPYSDKLKDVRREDIRIYSRRYTDIRLHNELYYTPEEYNERIDRLVAMQLP